MHRAARRRVGRFDQLAARRRRDCRRRDGLGAFHVEGHARGLAEDLLQLRRVREARHLHEDAVAALRLDRRLRRAERVQAAVEHLHALRHRRAHARLDARRRSACAVMRPPALGELDLAERALAEEARLDRRRERLQRLKRLLARRPDRAA